MNSEYNYERTVDLLSFLKAVLIHWRSMFILGLICSLCLGMIPIIEYKTGSEGKSAAEGETEDGTKEYITEEEYNNILERLETIIAGKRQYLSNSYIMKLDPFNEVVARETVYVDLKLNPEELEELNEIDTAVEVAALSGLDDSEEDSVSSSKTGENKDSGESTKEINSGVEFLVSRLLDEYVDFLTCRIDWTELAEELNTEPKYLDECLSADAHLDSAKVSFYIRNGDSETACRIREYAIEKMKEEQSAFSERFCDHDLLFYDGGVEVVYDSGIRNAQESFISEIATSETRYDNFKNAKSSYVYNAPARVSLNKKAILRNMILGFIAGLLIAAMFIIIRVFMKGRVISAKELQLSYDLKPLATLDSGNNKRMFSGIDARIERIGMGSDGKLTDDERLLRAAQMVELYMLDARKIILTGDVTEDELETTTGRLQKYLKDIKLEYCDTLLGQTARLRDGNGVILVEKKNTSRLAKVEQDIGIIGEMKIPVIGVILL